MGAKRLIVMRGWPGSGKTTLARQIAAEHDKLNWRVSLYGSDEFWGNPYTFVRKKLNEAHLWNQHRAMLAMIEGSQLTCNVLIIIDNTNSTAKEIYPYVRPAHLLGYDIEFVEPQTEWAFDVQKCFEKTTHSVPLAVIEGMAKRWERDLTLHKCLTAGFN